MFFVDVGITHLNKIIVDRGKGTAEALNRPQMANKFEFDFMLSSLLSKLAGR
jgi:hypothetical protein